MQLGHPACVCTCGSSLRDEQDGSVFVSRLHIHLTHIKLSSIFAPMVQDQIRVLLHEWVMKDMVILIHPQSVAERERERERYYG